MDHSHRVAVASRYNAAYQRLKANEQSQQQLVLAIDADEQHMAKWSIDFNGPSMLAIECKNKRAQLGFLLGEHAELVLEYNLASAEYNRWFPRS
jgi:hypothetical protein